MTSEEILEIYGFEIGTASASKIRQAWYAADEEDILRPAATSSLLGDSDPRNYTNMSIRAALLQIGCIDPSEAERKAREEGERQEAAKREKAEGEQREIARQKAAELAVIQAAADALHQAHEAARIAWNLLMPADAQAAFLAACIAHSKMRKAQHRLARAMGHARNAVGTDRAEREGAVHRAQASADALARNYHQAEARSVAMNARELRAKAFAAADTAFRATHVAQTVIA